MNEHLVRSCCATLGLIGLAHGQPTVTPPEFTTARGPLAINAPFGDGSEYVYQQIHTDLPAGRLFNQLAFRQGAIAGPFRTVDVELWVGDSDFDQRSPTFANNFTGFKTLVVPRQTISLNDWSAPPPGGYPAPFDAVFPFSSPWATVPGVDLCWQLVLFGNTAGFAPYALDTAWYQTREEYGGLQKGVGCTPTGTPSKTALYSIFAANVATQSWTLSWLTTDLVPGQPASLLLGAIDPNVAVPGLCTNLHVGGPLLSFTGVADPSGYLASPDLSLPYDPRFVNFSFEAQSFGLDPGRAGLPVTGSNGEQTPLVELPPAPVEICTIAARASATAATGVLDDHIGVIVEFPLELPAKNARSDSSPSSAGT